MGPARPNKTWAKDLPRPRSPFLLSFTTRLRKAADGRRSQATPRREGCCCSTYMALTRSLPRTSTSRDWFTEKCLSGGASLPLPLPLRNANANERPRGHLPRNWFCVFFSMPHCVERHNVNRSPLCSGRTQLLLWKLESTKCTKEPSA